MTLIKTVEIQNFRGFAEAITFDFENKSFILVTAPNGKGKTSLLDAIEWGLVGGIQRLETSFKERYSSGAERNLKLNRETILKNKYGLNKTTYVKLDVEFENKIYIIERTQDDDTLENSGQVVISCEGKSVGEDFLHKLVKRRDFYKYHICDMQKTYRFLGKSRGDMGKEFSDFLADHTATENIIENLGFYIEDIEKKKKIYEEQQKVLVVKQEGYQIQINKCKQSPSIQDYSEKILYEDENLDVKNMDIGHLNQQLSELYSCGFVYASVLLERKIANAKVETVVTDLLNLDLEIKENAESIKQTINLRANVDTVRQTVEDEEERLKKIKLNQSSLNGNSEAIIKLDNVHFTKTYWIESSKEIDILNKSIQDFNKEIETLEKGDEILTVLTAITVGKEGLKLYREELREKKRDVFCPVCGSGQFATISNEEITLQAQSYQAEHKELLEEKKVSVKSLTEKLDVIKTEQLNKAKIALQEAINLVQVKMNTLTRLNNVSKPFFAILKRLQKVDTKIYAQNKMLNSENIQTAITAVRKDILSSEVIQRIDSELEVLFSIINYAHTDYMALEAILLEIKTKIIIEKEKVYYNFDLLKNKISAVNSYINNAELKNLEQTFKSEEKKNKKINEEITNLDKLAGKVKSIKKDIQSTLSDIEKNEFEQVGPYLYKIFRKLSRDVRIEAFQFTGNGRSTLSLMDENKKSILNMFSDGQLSVFMLSYFLGNILRLKDEETFPIYFIDDITGCMDDINMLAFLDLMKYQLSKKTGAFDQLFFATCDERIKELLCWKMNNCNIPYCQVGIDEFDGKEKIIEIKV